MNGIFLLFLPPDLTENSIPPWMFETGAVYLHGYDKEGNKLCKILLFHVTTLAVKKAFLCVLNHKQTLNVIPQESVEMSFKKSSQSV